MELLCLEGSAPGAMVATLIHDGRVKKLAMTVLRHPAGGWRLQLPHGGYGPRCHAVPTAILLEASEAFAAEETDAEKLAAD